MKLYLTSNIYNINNIKNVNYKTNIIHTIYSDEGIFRLKKNGNKTEIKKLQIIDKQYEIIQLKNELYGNCLIDYSHEKLLETVYRIPYNHFMITEKIKKYQLRKNGMVQLVCIYNKNEQLKEMYFELHESIKHKFILDDIYSFLSLLN